ncbi:MAG TPA: hypothetical protein VK177_00670 [Flavobacteriales bacterium]|nr:hypothetical protein [Flavobacteriales bacterium]
MKTALIFLSLLLGGTGSTHYLHPATGKYTVKSSTASAVLPSGMAQVKFEFRFNAGCETNNVTLSVDGSTVSKTANAKNPRMNTMVKKGKHVFKLSTACDTVIIQGLDMKEKTSTSIDVEF